MHSCIRLCKAVIIIFFVMSIIGHSQPAHSHDFYDLEVKIENSALSNACPGQQNVAIPIYLKNFADTVAGFSFWLHLNRPDIMKFQTILEIIEYEVYFIYTEWDNGNPPIPIDSVVASPCWVCDEWDGEECISASNRLGYYRCLMWSELPPYECLDSVFVPWTEGVDAVYVNSVEAAAGNIDTSGTLTSGWEFIETRSLAGNGLDILISAFANMATPLPDPYTPGIGYPQLGDLPLIKIMADILPLDPGLADRNVTIFVAAGLTDYFNITNEKGKPLGIISEEVELTKYYMCEQWLVPDEICLYWNRVPEYECPTEGCDSIQVDTVMTQYLDVDRCCDPSSDVCYTDVTESECPDEFGGTGIWFDGSILITNGSADVRYCSICGDFDGNEAYNILDIVFLINYIYKGGPEPVPLFAGDTNGDGRLNILDIVCYLNTVYKSLICCDDNWLP